MAPLLVLLALLAELAFGYPQRLYARIGHPVTWMGALIGLLDRRWNLKDEPALQRRRAGLRALAVLLVMSLGGGAALHWLAGTGLVALLIVALLTSSLLAQRSLASHVTAVAEALEQDGLAGGQKAVAQIVGRDPDRLDEAAVARAAIESLAENFSDGVVAPAFWLALLGVPGVLVYKAVNTADSMIGHHTERHEAFGRAAARLDDWVNLPASRLAGCLIVLAAAVLPGASARGAWIAVERDARFHKSPNAGWPEAAMAGGLGISLAGPRHYGGMLVEDAEMNRGGRRGLVPGDIRRALRLYWLADAFLILLVALLAGLAAFW